MSDQIKILSAIQVALNAPKSQFNSFGKYNYRNCEDILEALKPLLKLHSAAVFLTDSIEMVGPRIYVKAEASIKIGTETFSATAFAREEESKKGMDSAQLTGSTSSYARKYALNGLFCIDDNKDADSGDNRNQGNPPQSQGQSQHGQAHQSAATIQKALLATIAGKIKQFPPEKADKLLLDYGKEIEAMTKPGQDWIKARAEERKAQK